MSRHKDPPELDTPLNKQPHKSNEQGMHDVCPSTDSGAPSRLLIDPGLRRATAEDVGRLKAAPSDAFYEDPIFAWLIPDGTKRRARLRRFFAVELRHMALPRGRVWTTNDLTGVALSTPPGAWRVPVHTTLLEGTAFGIHLHRAARLLFRMEWRHVREPHHYFACIGVTPAAQGQGLGSSLMRPTLERCDRKGLPAYIEASSERNAALYEHLGFQTTSELRVAGSPSLRLMLRPPHPTETVS